MSDEFKKKARNKRGQNKRLQRLNEEAQSVGFSSWVKLGTAIIRGEYHLKPRPAVSAPSEELPSR